ncbi:hypothetical protein [Streptosporangium amethystogenes]|uniref:hypothetical protein n=1 Tax=Streptosporangium amethystogenes TaxID=2002 RepID=UPI000689BEF7|nr:hypothetical protein [Streptosporangium amethystogenes]
MSGTPGLRMAASDMTALSLWTADAVVLFDWLISVDLDQIPVRHMAQKQALMDLLQQLDRSIPGHTQADIEQAHRLLTREMGL